MVEEVKMKSNLSGNKSEIFFYDRATSNESLSQIVVL